MLSKKIIAVFTENQVRRVETLNETERRSGKVYMCSYSLEAE
jgi:hypothetical protein